MKDSRLDVLKTRFYSIKPILFPFYKPYKHWRKQQINKNFQKNGLFVLQQFDKCLSDNNVNYMLGFGSLLGAIREHGFIKHDLDIDTCMWHDEYFKKNARECLEKQGFVYDQSKSINNGEKGMEVTFYLCNIRIDIFLIYPAINDLPYTCHSWMPYGDATTRYESMKKYGRLVPYRFEAPYPRETTRVFFNGLRLPVPVNYDEMLRFRYGNDYMIPDPTWKETQEKYIRWDSEIAKDDNF